MDKKIKKLDPSININTITDGRGGIFTYFPEGSDIQEWNYITTTKGTKRGDHYHPEFNEYIMFVMGHGVYVEKNNEGEQDFTLVGPGECVFIPKNTIHTFLPLEDCRMIALLDKKWDDCEVPSKAV
jgi:mannose-6-phosphate isomerase-like protein (cupin superfamily)